MKRTIFVLMIGVLLVASDLYAAGDVLVKGHLGVGVISTGFDLNVAKDESGAYTNLRVFNSSNTAGSNAFIRVSTAGSTAGDAYFVIDNNLNDWVLGVDTSDSSKFKISDYSSLGTNDRFAIDMAGRVGIGTSNPLAKLHVNSNADSYTARIYRNATGEALRVVQDGSGDVLVAIASNLGNGLTVSSSGWAGIGTATPAYPLHMGSGAHVTTGGVWINASSRSFKANIKGLSVEDAMETLKKLEPVTFNYKKDKKEDYVGFIAEDVPELVATEDRKGLSLMDIVAVLTRVVQEQQKTISALSDKVNALESQKN